jgi:hypothetical protein
LDREGVEGADLDVPILSRLLSSSSSSSSSCGEILEPDMPSEKDELRDLREGLTSSPLFFRIIPSPPPIKTSPSVLALLLRVEKEDVVAFREGATAGSESVLLIASILSRSAPSFPDDIGLWVGLSEGGNGGCEDEVAARGRVAGLYSEAEEARIASSSREGDGGCKSNRVEEDLLERRGIPINLAFAKLELISKSRGGYCVVVLDGCGKAAERERGDEGRWGEVEVEGEENGIVDENEGDGRMYGI